MVSGRYGSDLDLEIALRCEEVVGDTSSNETTILATSSKEEIYNREETQKR